MNKKYTAITLIILGVVLVSWGYNIYDSAGSRLSRAFSGDAPFEAWAGMIGGAVSIIVGIIRLK